LYQVVAAPHYAVFQHHGSEKSLNLPLKQHERRRRRGKKPIKVNNKKKHDGKKSLLLSLLGVTLLSST
jgi:hypothetical protein